MLLRGEALTPCSRSTNLLTTSPIQLFTLASKLLHTPALKPSCFFSGQVWTTPNLKSDSKFTPSFLSAPLSNDTHYFQNYINSWAWGSINSSYTMCLCLLYFNHGIHMPRNYVCYFCCATWQQLPPMVCC